MHLVCEYIYVWLVAVGFAKCWGIGSKYLQSPNILANTQRGSSDVIVINVDKELVRAFQLVVPTLFDVC